MAVFRGLRRTHYDLILRLFLQNRDASETFTIPYYIDSQGKISYKENNDEVSILYVLSLEPAMISNLIGMNQFSGAIDYRYFLGGIKWKKIFSESFYIDQQLSGAINYQLGYMKASPNELFNEISDNNLRYKITANYYPFETIGLKTGFETVYYPDFIYKYIAKAWYTNITTQ